MSPRDYCFWLMGAIELTPANRSSLTFERTVKEMREHLSLVLSDTSEAYQHRYPDDCFGLNFCRWLNEWLFATGSCLSATQLENVYELLAQTFMNEIDPSFSNSTQLQHIHDGKIGTLDLLNRT